MVDISPRSSSGPISDDPSWIGSEHGVGTNGTVTLNTSLFTAETHYPNGFIPSGTPLGKVSATGLYGPYDDLASDGRQTLVGFLYHPVTVEYTGQTASAAIYQHGPVIEANLPLAVDANGKTDVQNRIWFE